MNIVAGRNVVTKVCFTFFNMKYFPDNSGEAFSQANQNTTHY
jgi:hypothetical protein